MENSSIGKLEKYVSSRGEEFATPKDSAVIRFGDDSYRASDKQVRVIDTFGWNGILNECRGFKGDNKDLKNAMRLEFLRQARGRIEVSFSPGYAQPEIEAKIFKAIANNPHITAINDISNEYLRLTLDRNGNARELIERSHQQVVAYEHQTPPAKGRERLTPQNREDVYRETVRRAIYIVGNAMGLDRTLQDYKIASNAGEAADVRLRHQEGIERARGFRNVLYPIANYLEMRSIRQDQKLARKMFNSADGRLNRIAAELTSRARLADIKKTTIELLEKRDICSRDFEQNIHAKTLKVDVEREVLARKAEVVRMSALGHDAQRRIGRER